MMRWVGSGGAGVVEQKIVRKRIRMTLVDR